MSKDLGRAFFVDWDFVDEYAIPQIERLFGNPTGSGDVLIERDGTDLFEAASVISVSVSFTEAEKQQYLAACVELGSTEDAEFEWSAGENANGTHTVFFNAETSAALLLRALENALGFAAKSLCATQDGVFLFERTRE